VTNNIISCPRKEDMGKECLVVSRDILIDEGLIPDEVAGKYVYQRIQGLGELKKLLKIAKDHGEYRERNGEHGVEKDPGFQQFIMYGFVERDGRFLLYQRAGGANYTETRLAGKVSVGIGGHMERTDLALSDSFYREIEEEAQITLNGNPVNFRRGDGSLDVGLMRQHIQIKPLGLIKDERDEVGKVHLGIVCAITPQTAGVEVHVKTGNGDENAKSMYVTPEEYQAMVMAEEVTPEGWTDIVFREEIKPN